MTADKSIFGIRFESNPEINPPPDELKAFLASPKKPGRMEAYGDDLAPYRELLNNLAEFEDNRHLRRTGDLHRDLREKTFFSVIGHSRFVNPSLLSAVEQYKYHLHALATTDIQKPAAFIKSAEAEMRRLNPKNRTDAARLAKLSGMVAERKRQIERLRGRRPALIRELGVIARYIRDNLLGVANICETAIAVLVELQISRTIEKRLIEDIGEELRTLYAPSRGTDDETGQARAKDLALLSREMSALCRDDMYALTKLYEAVHDHATAFAREIETALSSLKGGGNRSAEDDLESFAGMERILVSLLTDYRFRLLTTELRSETAHEDILLDKRRALLGHLFEQVSKERRTRRDRRTSGDRRKARDANYKGVERRSGKDRRSGKNRRSRGPRT